MTTVDDVLSHFGVRGMKWGVRKDPSVSIGGSPRGAMPTKPDMKWSRQAGKSSQVRRVYRASVKQMNTVELPKLNAKPAYKGMDLRQDSPLRRAYLNEAAGVFNRVMNQQAHTMMGNSPSGQFKMQFSQGLHDPRPTVQLVQIVHDSYAIPLTIEWGPMGHILSCSIADPLVQSEEMADEVLEHFGVKGMRWGVRRTEAEIHGDSAAATSAHRKAKKHGTQALSNQELQALITRMNLERQYSQVVPSSRGSKAARAGGKFAADILISVGKSQITKLATDHAAKLVAQALKK